MTFQLSADTKECLNKINHFTILKKYSSKTQAFTHYSSAMFPCKTQY